MQETSPAKIIQNWPWDQEQIGYSGQWLANAILMPQVALEPSTLTGKVNVHLGKFWKKFKGHHICNQNGFSWDHDKETA